MYGCTAGYGGWRAGLCGPGDPGIRAALSASYGAPRGAGTRARSAVGLVWRALVLWMTLLLLLTAVAVF